MSTSETLSIVIAAAGLEMSVPGALLTARQLRQSRPASPTIRAPRPVVYARLTLFAYAATMFVIIMLLNAEQEVPTDTAIFFGVMAIVAAALGILLRAGRNWARVLAWVFSGLSLLYFAFLLLATAVESGLDLQVAALTALVAGLSIATMVLLMTSTANAYFTAGPPVKTGSPYSG